eukprot:CAMPEP_0116898218 /NCGR_PEP_ID=MMETSP0467-20121206/6979_1 /TAXON_ID=283647 /ORGANISM="Mesodinium pulex, Strain SPMC105" /LENGTH=58 /DNA_ID=CAMNT_0004570203 /DNA_START=337 /DNA_END=513 /DNA_ORIENTATION=+
MKASVALKPHTDFTEEQSGVLMDLLKLNQVDNVLVMTVEPGFGGQKFMSWIPPKIKKI